MAVQITLPALASGPTQASLLPRVTLHVRQDGWMFSRAYDPPVTIRSASTVIKSSLRPQCVQGHVSQSPNIASIQRLRRRRSAELPRRSPPFLAIMIPPGIWLFVLKGSGRARGLSRSWRFRPRERLRTLIAEISRPDWPSSRPAHADGRKTPRPKPGHPSSCRYAAALLRERLRGVFAGTGACAPWNFACAEPLRVSPSR